MVAALLCVLSLSAHALQSAAESTQVLEEQHLSCEARDTLQRIRAGGPFPYSKDGRVFRNREKRLPVRPYRYYTEYTVTTPGRADRGARRIVAGRGTMKNPALSGEYWYTVDHYQTFQRIRVCNSHESCAAIACRH